MRRNALLFAIGIGAFSALALLLFGKGATKQRFANGGAVVITSPRVAIPFVDYRSRISYQLSDGTVGQVELLDSFEEQPLLLMSPTNNILLCLYDFDVELKLLRIDASASAQPLALSNSLGSIVVS